MAEFRTIPTQFTQFRKKGVLATNATADTEEGVTLWDQEKGCFVVRREGQPDILLYCEQPVMRRESTITDVPNFLGSV